MRGSDAQPVDQLGHVLFGTLDHTFHGAVGRVAYRAAQPCRLHMTPHELAKTDHLHAAPHHDMRTHHSGLHRPSDYRRRPAASLFSVGASGGGGRRGALLHHTDDAEEIAWSLHPITAQLRHERENAAL